MKKITGVCALCGEQPATTEEHLPPKGIYPLSLRKDNHLHWVPSCSGCNTPNSADDEWFKVMMSFEGGATPEKEDVFVDWMAGTIAHNKKIGWQIFGSAAEVVLQSGGATQEPAISVAFDVEIYNRVITRIVRGLYWRQTQHVLDKSFKVTVIQGNALSREGATRWDELMNCLPAHALNNNLFFYKCNISHDGTSTWGMQFFSKHTVFAYVKPSDIAS